MIKDQKKRLVIGNMYRAKNKFSFFAIHQAITKLPEFDLEFHIVWDDQEYTDEWTKKIDELGCKIHSYSKEELNDYCREWGISKERIESFTKFKAVYFIVHAHLLKSKNITNYYLIYDDDIILKDDIDEFKDCLYNEIPCLIAEPMNSSCDKSMAEVLLNLYDNAIEYYKSVNPRLLGFNAGIQGLSLDMYEDFLDQKHFIFLLDLFNYNGIYDENGKELTGPLRSMIDTQQQSFFGIMNIIRSTKHPRILNTEEYFICPNWGTHPKYGKIDPTNEYGGWDINMKSKIVHFIGHTVFEGKYYGKPEMYHKLVDEYLNNHGIHV